MTFPQWYRFMDCSFSERFFYEAQEANHCDSCGLAIYPHETHSLNGVPICEECAKDYF